jgi:hypothetical protein
VYAGPGGPTPTTFSAWRPARCLVVLRTAFAIHVNRYSREFESVQSGAPAGGASLTRRRSSLDAQHSTFLRSIRTRDVAAARHEDHGRTCFESEPFCDGILRIHRGASILFIATDLRHEPRNRILRSRFQRRRPGAPVVLSFTDQKPRHPESCRSSCIRHTTPHLADPLKNSRQLWLTCGNHKRMVTSAECNALIGYPYFIVSLG